MGFALLLLSSTEGWSWIPCPSSIYKTVLQTDCFGTVTYDTGTYVGHWKDDKWHGQGTHTYANEKYVGGFEDGKKHGQGTFTYADGRVKEGIFENDQFLYAKKLSPTVTDKKSPLEKAKQQCAEIGFKKGTEKFGDCVIKLLN